MSATETHVKTGNAFLKRLRHHTPVTVFRDTQVGIRVLSKTGLIMSILNFFQSHYLFHEFSSTRPKKKLRGLGLGRGRLYYAILLSRVSEPSEIISIRNFFYFSIF